MPPRKPPTGRAVGTAAQRNKIQAYSVNRDGPRHEIRVGAAQQSTEAEQSPNLPGLVLLAGTGESLQDLMAFDENLDEVPVILDDPPPPAPVVELEDLVDDVEVFSPPPRRGMGQNEMLGKWLRKLSNLYLEELYAHHNPPSALDRCGCGSGPAGYRCTDCLALNLMCKTCIVKAHKALPAHRVEEWLDTAWSKTTLKRLGLTFVLGDHKDACTRQVVREFVLGDLTGLHLINIAFCGCRHAPEQFIQLLRGRIFPCSDDTPSTGFTFRSLRQFHIASVDAKLSGSRYFAILQRSTNNLLPGENVNRFREFVRAARQWMFLQDHKRAGTFQIAESNGQSLALRCPACPRLNVNHNDADLIEGEEYLYWQELSYDGSFQLVRKNKAYDEHDVCLSDGMKYWVALQAFQDHLVANKDTAYAQSTRGSSCNNHRAANDTWVRHTGVAESGLGAVTCARHTFYMPKGTVAYYKGERFANTDYAIASVISQLMSEGASSIGLFYDIYCHWYKGFWSRAPQIRLPAGALERPAHFFGGIPKYHLAGHTDGCYAQFSLNNMEGVGRLDAEGCERAWADLNQASGSTSERGPGSRYDAINHCMQDWNWRKTIGMITILLNKWEEASRMAIEQMDSWTAFHESLDRELTSRWETLSTEPQLINGTWRSVFLANETASTSMSKALLELNRMEQQRNQVPEEQETGYTAPSWISDGIDIEIQQRRIVDDIKSFGRHPTDKQTLELFRSRSSLSVRISKHRSNTSLFLDVKPSSLTGTSVAEETDGRPELSSLYLPSQLGSSLQETERSRHAKDLEFKLRRVACLRALQHLRTAAIYKAQTIQTKNKQARGERINTRGQTLLTRLTHQQDFAIWEYETSRNALHGLGASAEDRKLFRPLSKSDLSGLNTILRGERDLGEGGRKLPWFFNLRTQGEGGQPLSAEDELNEVTRVEWFRGRERYKRWQEEEKWLRREMASVVFYFASMAKVWKGRAESENARSSYGYKAYSTKQMDTWHTLQSDALSRCHHIMQIQPQLAICARLCKEFPSPPKHSVPTTGS